MFRDDRLEVLEQINTLWSYISFVHFQNTNYRRNNVPFSSCEKSECLNQRSKFGEAKL